MQPLFFIFFTFYFVVLSGSYAHLVKLPLNYSTISPILHLIEIYLYMEAKMKLQIQKATRTQRKARICLAGASGSGKTMTALRVARGLVGDAGKILVLDTERGSASLYADVTDYDVAELPDYFYDTYISAIKEAGKLGYEALIVDSLSHAWQELSLIHI